MASPGVGCIATCQQSSTFSEFLIKNLEGLLDIDAVLMLLLLVSLDHLLLLILVPIGWGPVISGHLPLITSSSLMIKCILTIEVFI